MRDLGLLGESTFVKWCAEVGIIPNGSQIDKTGWDFFVEFPFSSSLTPKEIHSSAVEFKVQVKATDKNERKLSITLSNLRRLITAQMPAFFIFLEFDGANSAQRAFVVHVDNSLITRTLKRLHEIEQSDKENRLNKRTMTIHYDDSNLLTELSGECLKSQFLSHTGSNLAEYISNKKSHLETTGFEDGSAQITFTTEGEDNLEALIDLSIGLEEEVEVLSCEGADTRFGIKSNQSLFNADGGKISMPNLKPTAKGKIRFSEDKLSAGLSFQANLYISPFNDFVPDNSKKYRVESDFFDLKFNPYTGYTNFSFSFDEGVRLEVIKFRDTLKLLKLLSSPGKRIFTKLIFDGFPNGEFNGGGYKEQLFNFSDELKTLNNAVKIITEFEVTDLIDISFDEISTYETQICLMGDVMSSPANSFKFEFDVSCDDYQQDKQTAATFLLATPIGSHIFGAIMVITGNVEKLEENRYRLVPEDLILEQKIVSEKEGSISNEDLTYAFECIEKKYSSKYSVVPMFDRKPLTVNGQSPNLDMPKEKEQKTT